MSGFALGLCESTTGANLLGLDTAAKTLHETLDEEKHIDERLTVLAENTVNVRAA